MIVKPWEKIPKEPDDFRPEGVTGDRRATFETQPDVACAVRQQTFSEWFSCNADAAGRNLGR